MHARPTCRSPRDCTHRELDLRASNGGGRRREGEAEEEKHTVRSGPPSVLRCRLPPPLLHSRLRTSLAAAASHAVLANAHGSLLPAAHTSAHTHARETHHGCLSCWDGRRPTTRPKGRRKGERESTRVLLCCSETNTNTQARGRTTNEGVELNVAARPKRQRRRSGVAGGAARARASGRFCRRSAPRLCVFGKRMAAGRRVIPMVCGMCRHVWAGEGERHSSKHAAQAAHGASMRRHCCASDARRRPAHHREDKPTTCSSQLTLRIQGGGGGGGLCVDGAGGLGGGGLCA